MLKDNQRKREESSSKMRYMIKVSANEKLDKFVSIQSKGT